MNDPAPNPKEAARQSFTGSRMTDSQFGEAWNITGIIAREIHKSGSFIEKLTDYAHAFARNQRFDAGRGEVILRDIYSARFGETMNQTREGLMAAEENLRKLPPEHALPHARNAEKLIREGATMPAYQAIDQASVAMARQNGITEFGARKMMDAAYQAAENRPLREACKELEATYHIPVRDAERAAREATRSQRQRSGPSM